MRIKFHEEPVVVAQLSADLIEHGVVYWHSTRTGFHRVYEEIQALVDALPLCARPNGDFMDFLVRTDLADEIQPVVDGVTGAIVRWQALGEPVPHVETL